MTRDLPIAFYRRSALEVAPELIGKVLVHGPCRGRIVEVEAYTADDPASHSFRGRTPRNGVMFQPGGALYVYRSYGVHWCLNVVTGSVAVGEAVLLRALEPLAGGDVMAARRGTTTERQWCRGPGNLCAALAISGAHDGGRLARGPVRILDDGTSLEVAARTRVGISKAADRPWRFIAASNRFVSR